jgi:hypothetical protein
MATQLARSNTGFGRYGELTITATADRDGHEMADVKRSSELCVRVGQMSEGAILW